MVSRLVAAAYLLLLGCAPAPCEQQYGYYFCTFDKYQVTNAETTPHGLTVDRGGQEVSLEAIDAAAADVVACLGYEDTITFSIVVASDWETSACTGEQVLPVEVEPRGCNAKGQEALACPCRYRAGISCPNTLVVTPNLKLLGDVMVRYLRHVQNPWTDEHLATCAGLTSP